MSTAIQETQGLVTEATYQLMEFDFTTINGSEKIYLSTDHQENTYQVYTDPVLGCVDGQSHTFKRIDFKWSGLRSDLTGAIAEPNLSVAAYDLWQMSEWASATTGRTLMDYRGLRVRRARVFFGTSNFTPIQTYFVKTVDELSATTISFTLTPSLGSEQMDQPSARKLEL